MEKDILSVEFFMPDGKTKKYVVGKKIDGRTIARIDSYDSSVRISLTKLVETSFSSMWDTTYLTMPTAIPHSLIYSEVKPWYAQPRY